MVCWFTVEGLILLSPQGSISSKQAAALRQCAVPAKEA